MIDCVSCKKTNRPIARYCKYCGTAISKTNNANITDPMLDPDFSDLIGLDELKTKLSREINAARNRKIAGISYNKSNLHTILMGNTGTGKTKIADLLSLIYFKNGITEKAQAKIVSASEFADFAKNLSVNLNAAKGGIVFIDNVHKLVPDGYQAGQLTLIDKLYSEIEKTPGDPIVILSGKQESIASYLKENHEVSNRFIHKFYLPDLSALQMHELAVKMLSVNHFTLSEQAHEKLKKRFLFLFRKQLANKDSAEMPYNGFLVQLETDQIINEHCGGPHFDPSKKIIHADDIKGEIHEVKPADEILKELDDFIGMGGVKDFIRNMVDLFELQKKDDAISGQETVTGMHIVITGNPGTGKTTVARKLGEILAAAEILPSGHLIEVERSKLIGQYKGETPKLVQKYCDEAMGGILFIDEAYDIKTDDQDTYGQEAINTLLKRMEDDRGKFVVIAAGYQKEMQNFINANPGMKSRVGDNFFHLNDYTPPQLLEIFKLFASKQKLELDSEAHKKAAKAFENLYNSRGRDFGNGRDVRNFFDAVKQNRSARLRKSSSIVYSNLLLAEDVPGDEVDLSSANMELILQKVNKLIGLSSVKNELLTLIDFLEGERMRSEAGGKKSNINLHFVFSGNPGTGKTTVARLLGEIFKSLGILSKGHLVEVAAQDLVAAYQGQTAIKTDKVIESAMGGVLFIDEAYTLSPKDGNTLGLEAINALLKRMEDDRGKFIVIAAGYTKLMDDFIKTNPGLDSRFTKKISFEDYNAEELFRISETLFADASLTLEEPAKTKLSAYMNLLYQTKDELFANGRTVRNVFDNITQQQSRRIVQSRNKGEVFNPLMITSSDIPSPDINTGDALASNYFESLDKLTGLAGVKAEINNLIDFIEGEKLRSSAGGKKLELNLHFVFKGNPGTGKTTVARLVGGILKSLGILTKGHLVEVGQQDLVEGYIGQTAIKTSKVIDSAMGGVLFIDEAYTLSPKGNSGNSFGMEAINTLLKRMEDDRGKFIVIAAGYSKEMDDFLLSNPGLDSRFTKKIVFEDYEAEDLSKIMFGMIKGAGMTIAEEAEEKVRRYLNEIYRTRGDNFGNARTVRNCFDEICQRQSKRIVQLRKNGDAFDAIQISAGDIPVVAGSTTPLSLHEILQQLNGMIGLNSVKNEINNLVNYLEIERLRATDAGKSTTLNLHFIFKGNPGTGKTTVARILANIFKALGLLPKGQLVEVGEKDLVEGYVGQTPLKTNKVIDSAIGGVLFIDEAYTLSPRGKGNSFGLEAINTLLVRMENDRGKIIVIAAGYSNEMNDFLDSNPGLTSRFTKEIIFDDYSPNELLQIFKSLCNDKKMLLLQEEEQGLLHFFQSLYNNRSGSFANGRTVRNIFEKSLQSQAGRLTELKKNNTDISSIINTIILEDIIN